MKLSQVRFKDSIKFRGTEQQGISSVDARGESVDLDFAAGLLTITDLRETKNEVIFVGLSNIKQMMGPKSAAQAYAPVAPQASEPKKAAKKTSH